MGSVAQANCSGSMMGVKGVAVQDKCPFKWPA